MDSLCVLSLLSLWEVYALIIEFIWKVYAY
jgi:hypothetical protein